MIMRGAFNTNARRLNAMAQPDANGNLIPNYIQEGSVVFSNPKGPASPVPSGSEGPDLSGRHDRLEAAVTAQDRALAAFRAFLIFRLIFP